MQSNFNLLNLTAKELFQQEFDAIYLEDKIALAEQISFCILKKIENQTTHKLKLVCSKQKCQFSIKLELSPIENKYHLRDIHAEHNHHISKEKFEEKMLTGRLLKYSDLIYKTYFINESEFCSKPKLILKDLKSKHNLDLLAGNYTAAQKQKLKKKFDNIVQQLRLKKNRVLGITSTDSIANPTAASLTLGSTALLPQFASTCENGLSSSIHLQSVPQNHVKKTSSCSFPTTRDIANSLSTAVNSLGDSTVKSQKKRNTSSSSSNFDFQNQETVYSPSQQNAQNQQILSAAQKQALSMFNNPSGFANPHFQLTFLQQQHLIQQQQQQQQALQQNIQLQQQKNLKQMSPQVISEDSRSASFCKVEDFGEQQSAASGNNVDQAISMKLQKVQNSPLTAFQNPINNIPCNNAQNLLLQIPLQQQQPQFGVNVNNPISAPANNGIHNQMIQFPHNQHFNTSFQQNIPLALQPQAQSQPSSSDQQIMMKLHENQLQQEQMKQEELKLKNLIQQRRIQEQQQQQLQQQQQNFNHFSPFMLQQGITLPAAGTQNIIQNPQQFMNLQLLLQNQHAANANKIAPTNIQGGAMIQPGFLPIINNPGLMINPSISGFSNQQASSQNIFQNFAEQNIMLNRIDQQPDISNLRNIQASSYFPNSGMIPSA